MIPFLPGAADPTSEEARRLLQQELAKAAYHQRSIADVVWDWIRDRMADVTGMGGSGPTGLSGWVTVVLTLALVALLVWALPKVQRERRVRATKGSVFGSEAAGAEDYRARAKAALARGDHVTAVLDGYRALARSSVDRTLVTDSPGLTAHEVAGELVPVFPAASSDLWRAAGLFDRVRYGGHVPDRDAATWLLQLEATLRTTRPVLAGLQPAAPR